MTTQFDVLMNKLVYIYKNYVLQKYIKKKSDVRCQPHARAKC